MIGLSVLSCFVVLFLLGRRDERAIRRDWELLLTPKGESLYRNIEGRVNNELALVDLTYDEAFAVRELGSVDEAKKLLDVGYRVIEKFSPNKLTQIVSLAYLNGLVHQFLVSTAERYRLKLYILGQSFGLATRFLLDSTQKIARGATDADREWEQIQAIRDDFQSLTDESLESLRVLLTSLAAERREDLLKGL